MTFGCLYTSQSTFIFHWFWTFAGKIALSSKTTGKRNHLVQFGYCHHHIKYLTHDMMKKGKVLESNAWSASQTLKKEAEKCFLSRMVLKELFTTCVGNEFWQSSRLVWLYLQGLLFSVQWSHRLWMVSLDLSHHLTTCRRCSHVREVSLFTPLHNPAPPP